MPTPRLFISFAGRDKEFVRRLIARLKSPAQDLDVWIYEDEGEEIPWGEEISAYLQQKLQKCDAFVPIVSANAFESRYARLETRVALETKNEGRQLSILPIVSHELESCSIDEWHGDYRELGKTRFRFVDFASQASLEAAVFDLCGELGVEYQPFILNDPRLPFLDRFVNEMREKCPHRAEHEIGIYRRLMLIFSEFERAFDGERFDEAEKLMKYLCMMCEYEFPNVGLYYAHVVRAVCHLQCNRLDEARQIFEKLTDHPACDETVFGGLGYIYQHQGDYGTALQFYQQAALRMPDDPAARTGVIVNRIFCGERIDLDADLAWLDRSMAVRSEDAKQLLALKVFALANAGRVDDTARCFDQLAQAGEIEAATLLHFARLLKQSGLLTEAIRLLEQFHSERPDADVLHYLATYTAFGGNRARAVTLFQELIELAPHVRQYRIEAAQMLWAVREHRKARQIVGAVLDRDKFPLSQSPNDFYYDGFANWMLGNRERADYDFERSGFPAEKHYRNLIGR